MDKLIVERLPTGIKGLDKHMGGGWVKESVNLVAGKTGTGKTAFSMSFLYSGAIANVPGIYVTTEQRQEDLKNDIKSMFGWDIDALEKKNLITFLSMKPTLPGKTISQDKVAEMIRMYVLSMFSKIEESVKKTKAQRIVIDSMSLIEMFIKDEYFAKVALMRLVDKLKNLKVTALLTGTVPEESKALSGRGLIEYVVDSIVKLDFIPVTEEFKRTLLIRKMRRTDHSTLVHPLGITKDGMKIIELRSIKNI